MDLIFNEEHIRNKLLAFDSPDRLVLSDETFTKSAILFLLSARDQKPYDLVLIRRTERENDKHSGEMGFPGGHIDPTDLDLNETALRECEEEIGIPRENVTILGSFDDHITPKKYIITPIVGFIKENQEMQKQEDEVNEIVSIPVSFFANKKNYRERTYMLGDDLIAIGNFTYKSPNGNKYVIFGASCHIIVHYIEKVHGIKLMKEGARRLNCIDLRKKEKEIESIAADVKKSFSTD